MFLKYQLDWKSPLTEEYSLDGCPNYSWLLSFMDEVSAAYFVPYNIQYYPDNTMKCD